MEKYSYIEKYFEGNLSPDEELIFEKLLLEDSDFAEAFEYEKNVKKAISLNERAALKQKLKTFEKSKKSYKWLSVAASFAILIGMYTLTTLFDTNYDSLYKEYYQTYPNTVSPTVRGETTDDIKSNAFYAYDSGNYKEAIPLFSEIYTKDGDDYALFYKALSLMEIKEYQEALRNLNLHDYTKENTFTPFFRWYAALTNLKLKNTEKTKQLLKVLTQTDNPQKEAAARLLSELE
ncbi:hypothetical protein GOQ30_13505 [Flavobacterium sp. TP390]|uniref:Tetratricopeptide repeat protein n=1 Tax=Flavobacterium profundi TaxID=1774945 RepID=A0A6I4ITJ3_9FLAO|nr:hypothetical protein [Flavobacterium profundi]MVO10183.1 hypothetical protein [Flavobacterium profundi]